MKNRFYMKIDMMFCAVTGLRWSTKTLLQTKLHQKIIAIVWKSTNGIRHYSLESWQNYQREVMSGNWQNVPRTVMFTFDIGHSKRTNYCPWQCLTACFANDFTEIEQTGLQNCTSLSLLTRTFSDHLPHFQASHQFPASNGLSTKQQLQKLICSWAPESYAAFVNMHMVKQENK